VTDERILVIGPAWVGDMIMAQSLFRALVDQGAAVVDVVAPGWSLPLLARMPEVREPIELPLGHGEFGWRVRRRLGRVLRDRDYTRAIVLPRSFKAALAPFFAGIPIRTGYRGEFRYGLLTDIRPLDPTVLTGTVQRYVALGRPPGEHGSPPVPEPRLDTDPDNQSRLLDRLGLATDRPVVAMMPGAEYGPAKCWPLDHFRALAGELVAAGYRVWVLGSERDRPAGRAIAAVADTVTDVCGKTRLEDAVDLLALARHAVTNDSGLMHMAAAVGCHVVAIYGSTTPAFTPPLTARATVFYLGLDCSPCFRRECPLGHLRCLVDIEPGRVFEALHTDLKPPAEPGSKAGAR
jgi:heptosyltransferase-2